MEENEDIPLGDTNCNITVQEGSPWIVTPNILQKVMNLSTFKQHIK